MSLSSVPFQLFTPAVHPAVCVPQCPLQPQKPSGPACPRAPRQQQPLGTLLLQPQPCQERLQPRGEPRAAQQVNPAACAAGRMWDGNRGVHRPCCACSCGTNSKSAHLCPSPGADSMGLCSPHFSCRKCQGCGDSTVREGFRWEMPSEVQPMAPGVTSAFQLVLLKDS